MMSNVITTKISPDDGKYIFIENIEDTTEYENSDWVIDPDISSVLEVPQPYWKWDASIDAVVEMNSEEKKLVDDWGIEVEAPTDTFRIDITDQFPKSDLAGNPIAVHASYKPELEDGSTTYAIWSGAGDDLSDPESGNGNGPLLLFETEVGKPVSRIDVEFNRAYGRVWLHEAYIKFTGAGMGDYISSNIRAYGVPLQQQAYLDLVVEDDRWIKYSPMGPGTGTHGFLDPTKITLIDRTFSADGDWDMNTSGQGPALIPNMMGNGSYKMSINEEVVHRYVNKVPCYGDCATYFSMSSDETTELRPGYFASVEVYNVSNTVWHLSVLMEIYRQSTFSL